MNKPEQLIPPDMPITLHPDLAQRWEAWTQLNGNGMTEVLKAGAHAIRTRHDEASLNYNCFPANGLQPDIFDITVDSAAKTKVIYTVEDHEVVIRGLAYWDDSLNRWDGGYYGEPHWVLPIQEFELN